MGDIPLPQPVMRSIKTEQTQAKRANIEGAAKRGRPKGRKTIKPDMMNFLDRVGDIVGADDLAYLKGVLGGTDKAKLERDIDIFLAIQLKALLPVLAEEVKSGEMTREATQRSSVVKELLTLRFQMEKAKSNDDTPIGNTYIQNLIVSRGIDPERLALLAGGIAGLLPGVVDGNATAADEARDVSGQLPQRQVEVQGRGEEPADRVQLDHRERGSAYDPDDAEQEGELRLDQPERSF